MNAAWRTTISLLSARRDAFAEPFQHSALWQMRIVSLIDQEDVIERILRHLGLWQEGVRRAFRHRPAGRNDPRSVARRPLPDYDTNRSWRSPPAETSGSARVRLSHPLFSGPQPSGGSPCLTSGPTFVTLRPWKRTLSASNSGPTPRRAKSDFLSVYHGVTASRLHRMSFESALGIAAVHEITANASKSGIRVPTRGWSIRRKTSRATCANARRFPDSAHWAATGVAYAAEQG